MKESLFIGAILEKGGKVHRVTEIKGTRAICDTGAVFWAAYREYKYHDRWYRGGTRGGYYEVGKIDKTESGYRLTTQEYLDTARLNEKMRQIRLELNSPSITEEQADQILLILTPPNQTK